MLQVGRMESWGRSRVAGGEDRVVGGEVVFRVGRDCVWGGMWGGEGRGKETIIAGRGEGGRQRGDGKWRGSLQVDPSEEISLPFRSSATKRAPKAS